MKKTISDFIAGAEYLQTVKANNERQWKVTKLQNELREKQLRLREEKRNAKKKFVQDAMDSFLRDMKKNAALYVNGWANYSHPFTKFISRTWKRNGWCKSAIPSPAYGDAVKTYTKALMELKKTLISELENNADFRQHILETSVLKNLDKIR